MKNISLWLLLILIIAATGCGNNCSTDTSEEGKKVIALTNDQTLSYPSDFYVAVSPLAENLNQYGFLTPSAASLAEADVIFDYANTFSARYYIQLSFRETDTYYERTWHSYHNPYYYEEIVFKSSFVTWNAAAQKFVLTAINSANIKKFAEFYFVHLCRNYYSDIMSSEISETPTDYISTIRYCELIKSLCHCNNVVVFDMKCTISKSTGIITPGQWAEVAEYYNGKNSGCY